MRGNLIQSAEGTHGDQGIKVTVSFVKNDPLTYDFFVHKKASPEGDYEEVDFVTIEPEGESLIHADIAVDASIEILMPIAVERVLDSRSLYIRFLAESLVKMLGHPGSTIYVFRRENWQFAFTFMRPERPLHSVYIPLGLLNGRQINQEHEKKVLALLMSLGLDENDALDVLACVKNPALVKDLKERQPVIQLNCANKT